GNPTPLAAPGPLSFIIPPVMNLSEESLRFDFSLLRDALADNYTGYVHHVWATIAVLLALLVWLSMSEPARVALARNPGARRILGSAIAVAFALHALAIVRVAIESHRLMILLAADPYVARAALPASSYAHFAVSWPLAIGNVLLDGVLFALLLRLVGRRELGARAGSRSPSCTRSPPPTD